MSDAPPSLPTHRLTATISFRDDREDIRVEIYAPSEDTARVAAARVGTGWGEVDDASVSYSIGVVDWERGTVTETESSRYGWVQEPAPAGMVQALPVTQHGDPELPEGVESAEITGEYFPATTRAMNLIRADSGGPSWPPQSTVTIPRRWLSYMSRIEQGLAGLREDAPPPEDPEACERWKRGESFLESELYAFCVPCDDVGDLIASRSQDLWLAQQFLSDFFEGWMTWEDENFDLRIQEAMP